MRSSRADGATRRADALNDFRRAVREALREAQKFSKDRGADCQGRSTSPCRAQCGHAVDALQRAADGVEVHDASRRGAVAVSSRRAVPHYRACDPWRTSSTLVPTSLKLASEYKRATHRNLRHGIVGSMYRSALRT